MPAPTTGLVLHWNLTSRVGTNYDDLSSEGNDGVPRNDPSFTTGTVGNSIHVTGTGADATGTAIAASTFGNLPISAVGTWCAWLRADTVGATRIAWAFRKDAVSNFRIFGFYVRGATTTWLASGGASNASSVRSALSNPNVSASKWYHLAVTYNATQASAIYLNGTFASAPADAFWADPGRIRRLGNNGAATGWAGDGDELRVYNRILNSTEIANIFADATNYPVAGVRRRPDDYYNAVSPRQGVMRREGVRG